MSHRRTLIREAAVQILTGATAAGDRVIGNRVAPLWDMPLPVVLVYAREESVRSIGSRPKPMERRLQLAIQIVAKADADLDKTLDDVALQVEQAFEANPTLKRTALGTNLVSTELDVSAAGDEPVGAARLTYEVIYEE